MHRYGWLRNINILFYIDAKITKTEARIPFVDADDIADVVVESLLDDKHVGQTYELTGPSILTKAAMARHKVKEGDYRDWNAIRSWAKSIDFHSV